MVLWAVPHVYTLVRLNSAHACIYLPGTDYPLRTHSSVVSDGIEAQEIGEAVNGIKGRSSLESIVDFVNGIPVDYMHCVLEGVTKKLLNMWITSMRCPCYIGRFVKHTKIF